MPTKRPYRVDESDHQPPTKRARVSPISMCSVAASPTDRQTLERIQLDQLDLVRVNERLTEIQALRDWAEECRSDDESSWGDDDIVQLADWRWGDDDTPLTQYENEGEDVDEERSVCGDGIVSWRAPESVDLPRAANKYESPGLPPRPDTYDARLPLASNARIGASRWSLPLFQELSRIYR